MLRLASIKWLIFIIIVVTPLLQPMLSFAAEKEPLSRTLQEENQPSGKLTLEFNTSKDQSHQNIARIFKNDGNLQHIVDELNRKFILPFNIPIIFTDTDGPVYRTDSKKIYMSYDFTLYLSQLFLDDYPKASNKAMIEFAEDSTIFFLYHELAHALIDAYNLPIVSNEETAADNLAIIIALEYTKDGYEIIMNTADLFDMLDRTTKAKYSEDQLWDEHALDSQRFYNILCLIYGRFPDKVSHELKVSNNKNLLQFIKEKGDYCLDYYRLQYQAWFKLLDIHFTGTDSSN